MKTCSAVQSVAWAQFTGRLSELETMERLHVSACLAGNAMASVRNSILTVVIALVGCDFSLSFFSCDILLFHSHHRIIKNHRIIKVGKDL